MFLVNKNSVNALAPELLTTKLSKKIPVALKATKNGNDGSKITFSNALTPKEQDTVYDKMQLNNVHIKSKKLFAMQTKFTYNDKEYEAVLQKRGDSFAPAKVYERQNGKLVEVEPFDFVNGKDGVYYNPDDLSKFISTLIVQTRGETDKAPMRYTKEIVEFINKNMAIENGKAKLLLNVDNVKNWANIVQRANTISDFEAFTARTRSKLRMLYPYMSEEKVLSISDTFTDRIKAGTFNEIGQEHITKITMSDIPTMKRLYSGQIELDDNSIFASRNKMLTNFLSKNSLEIKSCDATNYILAGISNSNIPIFYSSATINDNSFTSTFNKDLERVGNALKERLTGKTNIKEMLAEVNKDKDNLTINKYAFLSRLRDSLFAAKTDDAVKGLFKNIEAALKDLNADEKLTKNIFSSYTKEKTIGQQKNVYKNTLDNAMMLLRAEASNELEIKLTKSGDRIYNSQQGQNIPIEFLYSPNDLIVNLSKNVGLKKENNMVEASYGASLIALTEVENKNGKITPIKTHRLTYNETGYEQLSEIISKLAIVNNEGKLIYKNFDAKEFKEKISEYDFDIDKAISNLRKTFDSKFVNKATGELKATDSFEQNL